MVIAEKDTKAQLIKKLEKEKDYAVAAKAGADSIGNQGRSIYNAGRIAALESIIKIVKETLS